MNNNFPANDTAPFRCSSKEKERLILSHENDKGPEANDLSAYWHLRYTYGVL
jgi:hypothetical protein